jgi:hypothetical protein
VGRLDELRGGGRWRGRTSAWEAPGRLRILLTFMEKRVLSGPRSMPVDPRVPDHPRARLLAVLAASAVSCGHGQTEAISSMPASTETAVAPSASTTGSSKESDPVPLPPEALETLRKRADQRKLPDKAGEPCPGIGARPTSKTAVVICSEAGSNSYAVECMGSGGVFAKYGAAACDIRRNAVGDPCALTFASPMCDGRKIVECAPDGLEPGRMPPAFARGKVVTRACDGPRGCYTEVDEGLAGVTITECDEAPGAR